MDGDRNNSWPIIVGISAGVVGGIVAAVVLHSMRAQRDSSIGDAQEIIDRCHEKIKEIEAGLETLTQPTSA